MISNIPKESNLSVSFFDTWNIMFIILSIFLTKSAVIFLLFSMKYNFNISKKLSMKVYLLIASSNSGLLLK